MPAKKSATKSPRTNPEKKFAIVTGASSGIGRELAKLLAKEGHDLFICSGSEKIKEVVPELEAAGAMVAAIQADLAKFEGVEKFWQAVSATGRKIDIAALNAGVGVGGDFIRETSLEDELNMIQLNVTSTVHLAKHVAKKMVEQGDGKILITSSIAGTMPTPLETVYGATKAFDLSFAAGLRAELKDTGVTVTALQPGPTNTDFFRRAGLEGTKVGDEGKHDSEPSEVAKQGYDALLAVKDHIYAASMKTKIQGELGKFIPSSVKAEMHRKQAEPKTGTDK